MFVELGLSLYVSRPGSAAHVVQTFPISGEVYVFCNRFLGTAAGTLIAPEAAEDALAQGTVCCSRCLTAIEAMRERLAALRGERPKTHDHALE